MQRGNTRAMAAGIVAAAVGSAAAGDSGNVVATFGFTELGGSFDSTASEFTATADTSAALSSSGDVTRRDRTADFDAATFGAGGDGAFELSLDVSNITAGSADGVGSFMIEDADGDQISGSVAGTFAFSPFGFAFFNADLTDVTFTGGDLAFEGTSGGDFSIAGLAGGVFEGGLSLLFLQQGGLANDFSGVSVQADGIIVPTPGTLGLVGLAGLAVARRRR